MAIALVTAAVVVLVAIIVRNTKREKSMAEDGLIIERRHNFVKQAEIFTTKASIPDFHAAFEKMDKPPMGLTWDGDSRKGLYFKTNLGFEAQLLAMNSDSDAHRYQFNFTKWRTYNGTPQYITEMNALVTAVEKAFLSVDPSTKVETQDMKVKSSMF